MWLPLWPEEVKRPQMMTRKTSQTWRMLIFDTLAPSIGNTCTFCAKLELLTGTAANGNGRLRIVKKR